MEEQQQVNHSAWGLVCRAATLVVVVVSVACSSRHDTVNERPQRSRAERQADIADLCIENEARIFKCLDLYARAVVDARVRSGEKGKFGDSARRDRTFAILEQKEQYKTYTPELAASECRRLAPTVTDEEMVTMPELLRCLEIRDCGGWVRCAVDVAYHLKSDAR